MALKLIEIGVVNVETLISHRLPLQDAQQGFETVLGQKGLKVVIRIPQ